MTRIFSLLAAATVALGVSTLRAEDKKPYTDSEFVAKAASGGLHEVEMGKLASERAKRQEVKDFGKKMAEDHGKANMALKTAAASAGIIIVEKQNEEHQKMYDKFKAMTGGDFDAEYIKHMKHDHEMDIKGNRSQPD